MVWERLSPQRPVATLRLHWHAVCLTGMVSTSLWFVVMVNHAAIHRHFLYRHLFLMFLFMVLFVACRVRVVALNPGNLLRRGRVVSFSDS
jgi:hypothetical protein